MKAVSHNLPDPDISRCLELLSSARNVLVVGDANEELLQALDQRGGSIACVLTGSIDPDEAAIFANRVATVPASDVTLPADFEALTIDAVVLCDPSDRLSDLSKLLAQARSILTDGGIIVAGLGTARFDVCTRAGYVVEDVHELPPGSVLGSLLVQARSASLVRPKASQTNASPTVEALYLELEREQAARDQLLNALTTAERSAEDIQRRVSDLAARRNDVLRRNTELENAYRLRERDLLIERESRLKLQVALLLSQRTLELSYRDAARAEAEWYTLLAQLETVQADADAAFTEMRSMVERARRDRDIAKAHVERLTSIEESSKQRIADLSRQVAEFERQVADGGEYVKNLLRQITDKDSHARELEQELEAVRGASLAETALMKQYTADVRDRYEHLENALQIQMSDLIARDGEMRERETCMRERLAEFEQRLNEENRELRERVADAEHALAAQSDALIANMQRESAQLSQLVDTVQSSRFWKVKRWLSRLSRGFRS